MKRCANGTRLPSSSMESKKIPALLDEVHWLIENQGIRFILCGSSARKVRRGQANLLGGRAVRYELHPLIYPEIPNMLSAYRKRAKRRIIAAPKFYFFDMGIVAHLTRRGKVLRGSELFGKAFEHFIWMELSAHSRYTEKNYPISFWKTSSGIEVDFILGDHEVAVEVKSSEMVTDRHLKGLRAFREDYQTRRLIVISMDPKPRKTADGIDILPWEEFLSRLWGNTII
jgi:predicted AAA+ superfamily ATPase